MCGSSITHIESTINFFLNIMFICSYHWQIFNLPFYVMILSFMLMMQH